MKYRNLKYKLENIEHSYFCFEKECPICGGFNFLLKENSDNSAKFRLPEDLNDILKYSKRIHLGEIWSLKVDSPYPIYVMPIKDFGYFFRCVKVSEFTEFKGANDIVWNDWLIESWNSFPVLRIRFENIIERVDNEIFGKILEKYKLSETEPQKTDDILMEHFKEIELNYQNISFLEEDELLLLKLYELSEEKTFSFIEILENTVKEIKTKITDTFPILPDLPIFEPVPLAAAEKKLYRYGIENSKPLLEDENIVILYNFLTISNEKVIRLYFELFFNVEPERIKVKLDNIEINFNLLYKDKDNIYIDLPFKKGNYEIEIIFEENLVILPIKFKI